MGVKSQKKKQIINEIDDRVKDLNNFDTQMQAVLQNLDKGQQHLIDLLNNSVLTYGYCVNR